MSEAALTMLQRRAGQSGDRQAALHAAITSLADTRTAWLRAIECWRLPTIDTPVRVTPVTTEADALVLRIGRLIHAHPRWTPQHSKDIGTRNLDGLPPDLVMLAILHDANDAIARMADADRNTITAALAAQRIFAPSRTVSLSYATVARRYIRISADRSGPLLDAYNNIVNHSQQALRALDDLALSTQASSRVLALARQAAQLQHSEYPDHRPASDLPYQPGPVENAFRTMGTDDPGLLLRANALDKATRELLAEARDTPSSPVRLAAMDTPNSTSGTSAARPQPTARRPRTASPANPTRRHP
jgi:hypothetical protein